MKWRHELEQREQQGWHSLQAMIITYQITHEQSKPSGAAHHTDTHRTKACRKLQNSLSSAVGKKYCTSGMREWLCVQITCSHLRIIKARKGTHCSGKKIFWYHTGMGNTIKEGLRKWQPGIHLVIVWFSALRDWPNSPCGLWSGFHQLQQAFNTQPVWQTYLQHTLGTIAPGRNLSWKRKQVWWRLKLRLVPHRALSSNRREKN